MDFDIKIINGRIIDGTRELPSNCSIGIYNNSITFLGEQNPQNARLIIDAAGLIVCPGFIDAHSHSDAYLLIEPSAASKLYQGITTEINGNCGASAAPLNGNYKMPADWCAQLESIRADRTQSPIQSRTAGGPPAAPHNRTAGGPPALSWKTVAEYRNLYETIQPAINTALLVGHNTLHAGICGYEPRGASATEMRQMKAELERALNEGAIGLSSGLAYPPGSAVPRKELIELARVAGLYTTHMRSESGALLEAIDEAIDIAERAGAQLHISHLKASGTANWHKLDAALEKIRSAQNRLSITADRYPYTAGSTDLDILLPQWATYGGRDAILNRIRDPETRATLRAEFDDKPTRLLGQRHGRLYAKGSTSGQISARSR